MRLEKAKGTRDEQENRCGNVRLICDEFVRLLSLPEERLEVEARQGLKLIADLARWRDLAGLSVAEPAGVIR